jgi:hypothetical protein
LSEHESEHSRRRELVAGILGAIRAGLIVVVDRPKEALSIGREARAVVLSVRIVVPREDVARFALDTGDESLLRRRP